MRIFLQSLESRENICASLACIALAYELEIDSTNMIDRAASEGSYYDALKTWRIYAGYCVCSTGAENKTELCTILIDKLIERLKAYLALWGNMKNIVTKISINTFKDFIENVLTPTYKQHCNYSLDIQRTDYMSTASRIFREAWRRFKDRKDRARSLYNNFGETTFFKLLHVAFPELPPFDGIVCSFYRRDRKGQCSGIVDAYLKHINTTYELFSLCGHYRVLNPLLTYKTFAKILDQAAWLAHRDILCKTRRVHTVLNILAKSNICPRNAARILCEYLSSKGEGGTTPPPCFNGHCNPSP